MSTHSQFSALHPGQVNEIMLLMNYVLGDKNLMQVSDLGADLNGLTLAQIAATKLGNGGVPVTIASLGTLAAAMTAVLTPGWQATAGAWYRAGVATGETTLARTILAIDSHQLLEFQPTGIPYKAAFNVPILPYLGNVGTNTMVNNQTPTAAAKWFQSRIPQVATERMTTAPMIALDNWYVSAAGAFPETAAAGTLTVTGSIEYPAGVYTKCKWSGADSIAIATGTQGALSDEGAALAGGVIPEGATYWVNLWGSHSVGCTYSGDNSLDLTNGGAWNFSGTALPDLTMIGGIVNKAANTNCIGPALVVYRTVKPTVLAIGDSRMKGFTDTWVDGGGQRGEVCRSLVAAHIGCSNVGVPADKSANYVASNTLRTARKLYHSHVINQYGINDISAGDSAATLLANSQAIQALFADKTFFTCTVTPKTSGTFATLAGQAVDVNNGVRVTYNTSVRAGSAGGAGFFDLCNATESSLNSGKWQIPNYTGDGLHELPVGALAIVAANVFPVAAFVR